MSQLPVLTAPLHVPTLEELASLLKDILSKNFAEVEVKVIECPDLTKPPFNLAAPGLCGNCRLLDVGGEPNLFYTKNNYNAFNFEDVASAAELPKAFIIGPGAGSPKVVGKNSELIANVNIEKNIFHSHVAKLVGDSKDTYQLMDYPSHEFGLMLNAMGSDGSPGPVISIRVAKRTGDANFVSSMRSGLKAHYNPQGKVVALGGAFQITKGAIKAHIMPDFPGCDILTQDFVKSWLSFFNMEAPLTCLSVFVTENVGDMTLRLEHTHFFSDHNQGGHYHYDVTPDEVEYVGYYVPCASVYKIAKPADPYPWCPY
jgi:hypothetical protein